MFKLSTVMAAAALVAAMFTLSPGTAFAQGQGQGRSDDIVILKCAERVTTNRVAEVTGSIGPLVSQYQSTGGFEKPDDCSDNDNCADCLQELILDHGCIAGKAFPGSPVVVASQDVNDAAGTQEWHALEKYLFQCNPAGGPPAN